jgi:antibiotic biosynthesis monooxygenase (ABM) superfamily enzyme
MAMAVLVGLYPTVMLRSLAQEPFARHLGQVVAMLVGNDLSVAILKWAVMPMLNIILAPWLKANSYNHLTLSVSGLVFILAILARMALIFKQAFS